MNILFRWLKESLSKILPKETPQKNKDGPVLSFEGNNNCNIIFVENAYFQQDELSMIPTYHKNEAEQGSTGSKNSGTYVQNGLPPAGN